MSDGYVNEAPKTYSCEARLRGSDLFGTRNSGTLSQAILERCAVGAHRLSRSAAMDRQRRRSDRNRELAELR